MTPSIRGTFLHVNFNVLNLERSLTFYAEALGLQEVRRIEHDDFTLVYLGDGATDFQLELTWLKERIEPYDLGEEEFHLAFRTIDFDATRKFHRSRGWVCYENPDMGIYFIKDPDGYWLEILPPPK